MMLLISYLGTATGAMKHCHVLLSRRRYSGVKGGPLLRHRMGSSGAARFSLLKCFGRDETCRNYLVTLHIVSFVAVPFSLPSRQPVPWEFVSIGTVREEPGKPGQARPKCCTKGVWRSIGTRELQAGVNFRARSLAVLADGTWGTASRLAA